MARKKSPFGRKKFHLKLKKQTVYSISALLLWGTAVLIWLSFFRSGVLLFKLNSFLISQLGLIPVLFLPFALITGGLMITRSKTSLSQPNVFVGSLVILAALTGLFHGGQIGLEIWNNIAVFISSAGAFIFLIVGVVIGAVVMLNIPFEDVVSTVLGSIKKTASFKGARADAAAPVKLPLGKKSPLPETEIKLGGLSDKPLPKSDKSIPPLHTPLMPPAATDAPWHYPPLSLLSENIAGKADRGNVNENAATIEKTLEAFGVIAKVVEINRGPAVTQYALQVAIGTKLSKINALGSDMALALAAPTGQIRIEAPIPGRSLVGIEVPNRAPEFVGLRRILEDQSLRNHKSKLAVAMGLDVSGQAVVADIAKMPHVLIAGATGSGKSICINSFLASLLFRCSPQELNLILVDPKRVELTGYNGIPHLLSPVIVEPDKVLSALKWATAEMDRRYKLFAEVGVRNLESYNEMSGFQALPYLIIFIDELADIMLYSQVEV
ncbi:MAG: DNA translocase FtsK, partial [candidate division Zixibacteria bacterium]|nr:DNA translocase FtsK [candidate division Zixibacteria bacterium]